MAVLANRAWMTSTTTGTGTITLVAAVDGYATFAEAGVTNGQSITYCIVEGDDFEIGRGAYSSTGPTLSRSTVLLSKISGTAGTSKMDLAGAQTVFISAAVQDFLGLNSLSDPGFDGLVGWDDSSSGLAFFSAGSGLEFGTTSFSMSTGQRAGAMQIVFSGGGAVLTTGTQYYFSMPFAGTLTRWRMLGDQSGSAVVDVRKDTYANYPPTSADSICGSSKPTISSTLKGELSALTTNWTTSFSAGDVFGFHIDSVMSITALTLDLEFTKS